MATDIPDAIALNSWEEAFQFPIPTVRRAEQELRRDAESNKDKLRSLVGVKYRELLGTAQTIVDMKNDIQQVESTLSSVGRRCNSRFIGVKTESTRVFKDGSPGIESDTRLLTAHLSLLRNCTNCVVKLIRKRGSVVLAAKLLVISRLLLKALSQSESVPPYVDSLKKSLTSLRAVLLKRVKRRLAAANTTADRLVEVLSAFCLATSSTSSDAIRHFCEVRKSAISQGILLEAQDNGILLALKLYLKTLRQIEHLVSGPLANMLEKLTSQPLLGDPEILQLGELNVDVLKPWILADIQHFIPWIKYTEISKPERDDYLKAWSREALEMFSSQAKLKMKDSHDFGEILNLRKQLLQSWLLVHSSTPTHSDSQTLESLQGVVNNQLISILRNQAEGLNQIGREIASVVKSNQVTDEYNKKRAALWEPRFSSTDVSEGATVFKEEIVNRTLGRGARVLEILNLYQSWIGDIHARAALIRGMKNDNWEDFVENGGEEDVIDYVNRSLRDEDPALFIEEHRNSLINGFSSLETTMTSLRSELSGPHKAFKAVFLLRAIREIQSKLPKELPKDHQQRFTPSIVPELQDIVASDIVCRLSEYMDKLKPGQIPPRCIGRSLWDGKPEMPVQPSPAAFKLLHKLALAMDDVGADLWNPSAVLVMKQVFMKALTACLQENATKVTGEVNTRANADEDKEEVEEEQAEDQERGGTPGRGSNFSVKRDCQVQTLFDVMYLSNVMVPESTAAKSQSPAGPGSSITSLLEHALGLEGDTVELLRKRSYASWERTRLLFGLLVC